MQSLTLSRIVKTYFKLYSILICLMNEVKTLFGAQLLLELKTNVVENYPS